MISTSVCKINRCIILLGMYAYCGVNGIIDNIEKYNFENARCAYQGLYGKTFRVIWIEFDRNMIKERE